MAEGGDNESGNEIPENPEYILFAEDLVNDVMLRNSYKYTIDRDKTPFRKFVNNPFDETIKRAICLIEGIVEEGNMVVYNEMCNSHRVTTDTFTLFANLIDIKFITEGFDAESFLFHCATISGMAALVFDYGLVVAPELAKSNIIRILQTYMPAGGWNSIRKTAEIYANNPKEDEPLP